MNIKMSWVGEIRDDVHSVDFQTGEAIVK